MTATAAAPVRAPGPGGPGRGAAGCLPAGGPASPCPWTTRLWSRPAACSGTAASSSSTTRSTWPRWPASPWSSAPPESCGKCTPCRVGPCAASRRSTASSPARRPRARTSLLLHDLCTTMTKGSLCAMGGLTPMPVLSAVQHFAGRLRHPDTTLHTGLRRTAVRSPPRQPTGPRAVPAVTPEPDYGTPAVPGEATANVTIDGIRGAGAAGHLRHARRQARPAWTSPSCAPPTRSRRSAPAGCAWSRSKAPRAPRLPAPRPAPTAWSCGPTPSRCGSLRRGVMELYLSDHPTDCAGCARGSCEMQDLAAPGGRRGALRARRRADVHASRRGDRA